MDVSEGIVVRLAGMFIVEVGAVPSTVTVALPVPVLVQAVASLTVVTV